MLVKINQTHESELPICGLDWVLMSEWPKLPDRRWKPVTLVDLFCSCGGMTLGAWEGARQSKRRLEVRLAVDLKPEPTQVYYDNFYDITEKVKTVDVTQIFDSQMGAKLSSKEIYWKRKIGKLDLLVAGPPCQGHSDLNNSTRRKDPRNVLYLRVARAAEILNPKAVIIENVPAVQHDKGEVVQLAEKWLSNSGYQVTSGVVQFSRFGVPQNRKRHIVVAVRESDFALSDLKEINVASQTLGKYLSGLEESANSNGLMSRPAKMAQSNIDRVEFLFKNDLYDLPDKMRPPCHRDKEHAYVSMYGRMFWDKPAQTLTSGFGSMGQGRYVHPKMRRLITPHEAARLQGLPDFFDFSSVKTLSALREMIANAVPPQFTATLVSRLIQEGVI